MENVYKLQQDVTSLCLSDTLTVVMSELLPTGETESDMLLCFAQTGNRF